MLCIGKSPNKYFTAESQRAQRLEMPMPCSEPVHPVWMFELCVLGASAVSCFLLVKRRRP